MNIETGDVGWENLLDDLCIEDVLRKAKIHRATGRRGGHLDGPANHPKQATGMLHHRRPFSDRLGHCNQVCCHLGIHCLVFDASITTNHHEGRIAPFGLVEVADRIA